MNYSDLSNRDLREMKFENESFIFTSLVNSELPSNMVGANLYGCDLTGARISLQCSTFSKLIVDPRNFKLLLYILSKIHVQGIVELVVKKQMKELLKRKDFNYEDFLRALVPQQEYMLLEKHNEDEIL